jgi:hypothetical protein
MKRIFQIMLLLLLISGTAFGQDNETQIDIIRIDSSNYTFGYNIGILYPNPYGRKTELNFTIGDTANVLILLCDTNMITVKNIFHNTLKPGEYKFELLENRKIIVKPGIYYIVLEAETIKTSKYRNSQFKTKLKVFFL